MDAQDGQDKRILDPSVRDGHPMLFEEVTRGIIGCAFEVINELGSGFLEAVYESAMMIALRDRGFETLAQYPAAVRFRGQRVGTYYADLVVDERVIVELKAVKSLQPDHAAQVINYLNATGFEVGLLLNFGRPKLEYKRFVNRRLMDTCEDGNESATL